MKLFLLLLKFVALNCITIKLGKKLKVNLTLNVKFFKVDRIKHMTLEIIIHINSYIIRFKVFITIYMKTLLHIFQFTTLK